MTSYDFDYLIVGSGFGGSVSALRLTEKGYSVGVMEMGKRWGPENFPKTSWNLWKWLWKPALGMHGFFNMKIFRHVVIAHGNAVGGGSVTYAATLLAPPDSVWRDGSWAGLDDWTKVMPGHYATAKRMLGVVQCADLGPADHMLKKMAEVNGVAQRFHPVDVGIFYGDRHEARGREYPDPYFGGEGPPRSSCVGCGGCAVGCRYNAKNSLDKNYLYLAEKRGTRVFAETRVVDVRPLKLNGNGRADGTEGYEVLTEKSNTWFARHPRRFTARHVIFAASSLGTQDLLFRLKQQGSLPMISDDLGKRVRTNAESVLGVRFLQKGVNMTPGPCIASSVHIDDRTHIEAIRYPKGSDTMGLMMTPLGRRDQPGFARILDWLLTMLGMLLRHPLTTLRLLLPFGWAIQTLVLVCMQTLEGHLNMRFARPWYWPFCKTLISEGAPISASIPEATAFVRRGAAAVGGHPMVMIPEIFFNVPLTAHCMGGCAMADSPERGVIDAQNRVFGYQNLFVVDGSILGANLGVNPSLTITALAERAMSFIPSRAAATGVQR